MTRIFSGTATATNGSKVVTITGGDPLSVANCPVDAPISLNGYQYHVESRTDTTHLMLTRNFGETTGAVIVEIDPLTPDALSVVNIAVLAARVQAQLNLLDKNSQGLFYNRVGVTGDTDTAPGNLAFDSSDPTSVSELYIDNLDGNQRSVTGLLDLWTAGTVVLIRSLATTAYVSYRLPSGVSIQDGYYKASTQYVDHDGVIADGEAVSIGWFRVGEGLEIDATGTYAQRSTYDLAPAGFIYLSSNGNGTTVTVSSLFRKTSETSGDWSATPVPFQGAPGDRGWAPRFTVATDGQRRVLQLAGYVGGTGVPPTASIGQYVSSAGYTTTIGSATDIRGSVGISAYQQAVLLGFAGDETAWLLTLKGGDGTDGSDGTDGLDGTDPGVYFVWDTGTSDSNPGTSKIRGNNVVISSSTFMYVSKSNRAGADVSVFLSNMGLSDSDRKGTLLIQRIGTLDQVAFDVLSTTDAVGYVKVEVANGAGSTSFTLNDPISFQFSAAGDRGTNGDGAGDVVGPAVSVTDTVPLFDGTSGKLLKSSSFLIGDLVKGAQNGLDFADRKATLDNLTLKASNIASAATLDLDSATGHIVDVTGTVQTTAITLSVGRVRWLRATGAWPIKNNSVIVVQNGGNDYTAVAGDMFQVIGFGSHVRVVIFPLAGPTIDGVGVVTTSGTGTGVAGPYTLSSTPSNGSSIWASMSGAAQYDYTISTNTITFGQVVPTGVPWQVKVAGVLPVGTAGAVTAGAIDAAAIDGSDAAAIRTKIGVTIILTPYDFGAVGDGIADDTVALQSWIDSGEKRLYMAPGLYRVTATIRMDELDAVHVFGDGGGPNGIGSSLVYWDGAAGGAIWRIRSCRHCIVEGIGLQGIYGGLPTSPGTGFYLTGLNANGSCHFNSIRDCTVSAIGGSPGYCVLVGSATNDDIAHNFIQRVRTVGGTVGLVQFGTQTVHNLYEGMQFLDYSGKGAHFINGDVHLTDNSFFGLATATNDVEVGDGVLWALIQGGYHEILDGRNVSVSHAFSFPNGSRSYASRIVNNRVLWNIASGDLLTYEADGPIEWVGNEIDGDGSSVARIYIPNGKPTVFGNNYHSTVAVTETIRSKVSTYMSVVDGVQSARTIGAKLAAANFNITTDQSILIRCPTPNFKLSTINVYNASGSLASAVGGIYTAAAKGGTAILPAATAYTSMVGTTSTQAVGAAAGAGTFLTGTLVDGLYELTVYFALTTAQGTARTADVELILEPLP